MLKILKRLFPASWKQRVKNHLGVPSMNAGLLHLKNIGFQPAGVLDIGAYHGEWTVEFLHVFPNASVLMIEAQPAKEKTLQAISNKFPQVQYEMTLLGAHPGDKVHFYTNETASHAVLAAEGATGARLTQSLDKLMEQRSFPAPNFLKLDVQGFELEVLKGAVQTLSRAEFCLLEVSLLQLGDEPLLAEVMAFMDQSGFQLYDIWQFMRRPYDKALYQFDALFIRKTSQFITQKRWN